MRRVIGDELEVARCMIVVWSESSVASTWVLDEADVGLRRGILIPVAIDRVQPPLGFRAIQTRALSRAIDDPSSQELSGLMSDIGRVLDSPTHVSASQRVSPVYAGMSSARRMWLAAVALLVAGLGGVWLMRLGTDGAEPRPPEETLQRDQPAAATLDNPVASNETAPPPEERAVGPRRPSNEINPGPTAPSRATPDNPVSSNENAPPEEHAARAGDVRAMNVLGRRYETGRGVAQNDGEAMRWYLRAVEAGDGLAMKNVGALHEHGRGVAQDLEEAVRWYRKSAAAGSLDGMISLGTMYGDGAGVKQDYVEATRWYQAAAEKGHALAMRFLADHHRLGRGVAADPAKAIEWYRKAAASGDAGSMGSLGYVYGTGAGVPVDHTQAQAWYLKGAAGGDLMSMDNLGRRYETGRGVEQDYREAIRWYRRAAAGGYEPSVEYLGKIGESSGKDIGGRWVTPEKLVFQFQVRGTALFGNIQEGYGRRAIIGGPGYFDRVVMDGRIDGSNVTFHTIERFSTPQYSRDASGQTVTTDVDREVKTRYAGTIRGDRIEFLTQRDDGRPSEPVAVSRMCPS